MSAIADQIKQAVDDGFDILIHSRRMINRRGVSVRVSKSEGHYEHYVDSFEFGHYRSTEDLLTQALVDAVNGWRHCFPADRRPSA